MTRLTSEHKETPTEAERAVAQWIDDNLSAEEVDAMVRWLREASRTALLGRSVEKARKTSLMGFSKKNLFERTSSQKIALEALQDLQQEKKEQDRKAKKKI